MSGNSCNRDTSHSSCTNNARSGRMYRGCQPSGTSQMYRSGTVNRGMTGAGCTQNRMSTGTGCSQNKMMTKNSSRVSVNNAVKESMSCGCKEEKSEDYRHQTCDCFKDSCNQATAPVDSMMVAMAYVPWQQWGEVFDYEKAIQHGTIFEELVKPWTGRACE